MFSIVGTLLIWILPWTILSPLNKKLLCSTKSNSSLQKNEISLTLRFKQKLISFLHKINYFLLQIPPYFPKIFSAVLFRKFLNVYSVPIERGKEGTMQFLKILNFFSFYMKVEFSHNVLELHLSERGIYW